MRINRGFTLIELMIVVAIIALLATLSVPTYQGRMVRAQVEEALQMAEPLQSSIASYYSKYKRFPADNRAAGIPLPPQLVGNFVKSIEVEQGALHIVLGNRINAHADGKVLTLRPALVKGSPASPIAWLCGYAEAVDGMQAESANRTDLSYTFLGPECRSWRAQPADVGRAKSTDNKAG